MREYIERLYPAETIEFSQENIDLFFNFMNERHLIWHNRFVAKLPKDSWTNDPILKVTKYTNIYRELDRGTLWWLDTIGKRYLESKDFKNMLWETVIYRLCNRIETFEECAFPDNREYDSNKLNNYYWERLEKIRARGESVMTSAHLTCPSPAGYTKVEGFVLAINSLHKLLDRLVTEIQACKTSKEVFNSLLQVHCVGNFTAYEVLCDLMYVKSIGCIVEKDNPRDRSDYPDHNYEPFIEDDFANVGPGAYQGIRLLYPSSTVGKQMKKNVYARMLQLRDEQAQHFSRLGINFKFYERFTKGHLSLRSIEHSLCEMSKFWLQKHNVGKQRMIFKNDNNKPLTDTNGQYRIIVDPDNGEHIKKVYL